MQPMTTVRAVNGQASDTFITAMKRAAIFGVLLGVAAFVEQRPDTGPEAIDATYNGLKVFLGVLSVRGVAEGVFDARRQSEGNVNAADVQTSPPAVVVKPVDAAT